MERENCLFSAEMRYVPCLDQLFNGGHSMRYRLAAYIVAIFGVGIGGIVASASFPAHELVIISLAQIALAVLTFPLGFAAAAIGALVILAGVATPAESLLAMTPVYALLGYIQWWRLLPALYRKRI
jgi:hypothetical protein